MSKILLVTDIFPPQIGGPATFIDRLGHSLARDGRRVTVLCSSSKAHEPGDKDRPFRVVRVVRGQPLRFEIELRAKLLLLLCRHSQVLVNGLEYPTYQVANRLGSRYLMKIVGDYVWEYARNQALTRLDVDEFQAQPPTEPSLTKLYERRRLYLHGASRVIVPSQYLRGLVAGWGVPKEKIEVIENGTLPVAEPSAGPPRASGEPLHLVFIGRLTNWKGVETLLLACQSLQNVRVRILGDGPEWPLLQGLTTQLGLCDRTAFLGRVVGPELERELRQAHAIVLPSAYEGMSHTLLEANAQGLPVIASDRGGNPEVVTHGSNGLLVPYGQFQPLRQAICRLRDDEPFRQRLAEAALERSRSFDFSRTLENTTALLADDKTIKKTAA